jgi:hypothetical protein
MGSSKKKDMMRNVFSMFKKKPLLNDISCYFQISCFYLNEETFGGAFVLLEMRRQSGEFLLMVQCFQGLNLKVLGNFRLTQRHEELCLSMFNC